METEGIVGQTEEESHGEIPHSAFGINLSIQVNLLSSSVLSGFLIKHKNQLGKVAGVFRKWNEKTDTEAGAAGLPGFRSWDREGVLAGRNELFNLQVSFIQVASSK